MGYGPNNWMAISGDSIGTSFFIRVTLYASIMKTVGVFCLLVAIFATAYASKSYSFSHLNVFNWMKTLTNPEIYALIAQKNVQWPTYNTIPPASFSCADKAFPGFYADPATQCQTFHRCDINGNMTSYICVNRTVFNPITLVCDQWFNVDCEGLVKDEYFGNRRLYTKDPLFDTVSDNHGDQAGVNGKWVWVQDDAPAVSATAPTDAPPAP